jgi:hypothetical protein
MLEIQQRVSGIDGTAVGKPVAPLHRTKNSPRTFQNGGSHGASTSARPATLLHIGRPIKRGLARHHHTRCGPKFQQIMKPLDFRR